MPRVLLCDLDGVLRDWPEEETTRVEQRHGLPTGAIGRAAFRPELLDQAVTGRITDEEWRELIAREVGAAAVGDWVALTGRVDPEMRALVEEVRAGGVPVVLTTNATTRLGFYLEAVGLARSFDAIANSSLLGVAKPRRELFERAAALVGAPLADCVLVDDLEANVNAARAAGAAAVLHEDARRTRAALLALGLPVAAWQPR